MFFLDSQSHHIMISMGHGHTQLMHTSFRNVVYRLTQRARTQPKLEPIGLVPNNPQQRPAIILISALPGIQISSWRRFPRLALDCAITSPFQQQTQQIASSSPLVSRIRYADLKRKHLDTKQQCEQQHIGFEPLIMESTEGMIGETATLLSSLCGIIDRHEGLSPGSTWQECRIRLDVDLQRGLHGACCKQRAYLWGNTARGLLGLSYDLQNLIWFKGWACLLTRYSNDNSPVFNHPSRA